MIVFVKGRACFWRSEEICKMGIDFVAWRSLHKKHVLHMHIDLSTSDSGVRHGKLITTTKCQDVVFLIVLFREGLHAHHAMQAIVVRVLGCFCCIVILASLHSLQNGIPSVWILLNFCPTMRYCCLHVFKRLQSLSTRMINAISFIFWFVFVGHATFTPFHAWQKLMFLVVYLWWCVRGWLCNGMLGARMQI